MVCGWWCSARVSSSWFLWRFQRDLKVSNFIFVDFWTQPKKRLRKCDSAQIIILMIIYLKLYPTLFWKLKKSVLIWENNSLIVFIYGLHFSIKNVFFIGYTYLFQRKKLQNVSHVQLVRLKVHQLIEMSS